MGRVLLVRHGQASFGTDDYDVLSPTGWEQGRLLGSWLAARSIVPTAVIWGDLRRHRETVEAIAEGARPVASTIAARPLDRPEVDGRWDEFDHLAVIAAHPDLPVDLADRRGFQRVFEQATARWTAGDGLYPESFEAFSSRVAGAMTDAVGMAGAGRTVLVVSSGGPIATVAAGLTGGDWLRLNPVLVNTSVSRVVVGSTGARLLTFNEHDHLSPDTLTYR